MGTPGQSKIALLARSSSEEQDQERAATIVTYLRQQRVPEARKLLTHQATGPLIGRAGYSGPRGADLG